MIYPRRGRLRAQGTRYKGKTIKKNLFFPYALRRAPYALNVLGWQCHLAVTCYRRSGFLDINELATTHIAEISPYTAAKLPGTATDLEGKFSAANPGACPIFASFWSRAGVTGSRDLLPRGTGKLRCLHRAGTDCNQHYV